VNDEFFHGEPSLPLLGTVASRKSGHHAAAKDDDAQKNAQWQNDEEGEVARVIFVPAAIAEALDLFDVR